MTARALAVWGRKTVKLAAATLELVLAKGLSLHSVRIELRQRKGEAP